MTIDDLRVMYAALIGTSPRFSDDEKDIIINVLQQSITEGCDAAKASEISRLQALDTNNPDANTVSMHRVS